MCMTRPGGWPACSPPTASACDASAAELANWESGQDMVGLYLLNGPEYLVATLGSYAARAAAFNVNFRYVAGELAYLLNDAQAAALVYHARFAPVLAEVLGELDRRPLLLQVADESGEALLPGALDYDEALAAAAEPPALDHSPDDLYVLYTGGTTGMPKGTLWRQADIYTAVFRLPGVTTTDLDELAAVAAASGAGHRIVPNAPFMHGAAHWLGVRALLSGGTVLINGVVDHLDAADAWSLVARERATAMLMVGEAMARPLLAELARRRLRRRDADRRDRRRGDHLAGDQGAAARAAAARRRDRRLGRRVGDRRGDHVRQHGRRHRRARRVHAGAERRHPRCRQDRPPRPGRRRDRLVRDVRGDPARLPGRRAQDRRHVPRVAGQRWAIPGDRARLRADGMVELLGRDSVTINSGGEKIFAEEVEQALIGHPAVADVVVVGRPSERWGQEVVAVVALNDGHHDVADEDLRAAAAATLARFKLPKGFVRVPQLVRSPAGKADYRWARDTATAAIDPGKDDARP